MTHGTELSGRKPSESGIVGDLDAISLTKSRFSFNSGPKPLSGFLEAGSPMSILLPSLINRSRGPWARILSPDIWDHDQVSDSTTHRE